MKKSFKFSAILLALITSASGLAPVGAIPPVKPNAESKEKTTEKPQKRAREDENSEEAVPEKRFEREEEVIPQIPCAQAAAAPSAQAAALVPSKQEGKLSEEEKKYMEISSQLYDFREKHTKIMDNERYMLHLSYCLAPKDSTILIFELPEKELFNLNEAKARYVESMEGVSSDIKQFLDIIKNHSIPNGRAYRTPNQLTALSLITMLSYLQDKNAEERGSNGAAPFTEIGHDRLCYLLAISKFKRDPSVPELDTDTPPDSFFYDAVDMCYNNDEMSLEISFYLGDKKTYGAILKG